MMKGEFSTAISRKDNGSFTIKNALDDAIKVQGISIKWVSKFPYPRHGFVFFTDKPFVEIIKLGDFFSCPLDELEIVES